MIYYEVIEDLGDGENATRRFRTLEEAEEYVFDNPDWCYFDPIRVDTESQYFFYKGE